MSTEVDKIIVSVEAHVAGAQANVARWERSFDGSMTRIGGAAVRAERQIVNSSGAIGNSLKGLAGTFATAFSTQQVVALTDSYTRLQNNLRLTGLEGQELKDVQDRLFVSAQKYGVSVEELSRLYGSANQAAADLGVGQSQLLTLTNATAAALKVTGTSTIQAQGAILGLTQALGAGTVRAEEFNQINEGGLRPLLQLAANSEKYGGSVGKLRAAIVDGKVSSQELFQAILDGSDILETKAVKATLTLSAAFTVLSNKLIEYVGGTASANGATGAVAEGIRLLADNIETIAQALGVITVAMGVKYVASAGLAATATLAKSAADVRATQTALALATMQARLNPLLAGTAVSASAAAASVTALSVAQGVAVRGLAAFAAVMTGPVGIALAALAVGIAYATLKTDENIEATGKYRFAQAEATGATDKAQAALDKLATAHGKARAEALALAKAERENVKQKLASAQASLILAEAEASRARSKARQELAAASNANPGSAMMAGGGSVSLTSARRASAQADANAKAAEQTVIALTKKISAIDTAITAPEVSASPSPGKKDKPNKSSGPTAEEIAFRNASEQRQLDAEIIRAKIDLATDIDERARLERELLAIEKAQRFAELDADKDIGKKARAAREKSLVELYGARSGASGADIVVGGGGLVSKSVDRDVDEQRRQIAIDALSRERAALEAEAELAPTRQARLDAELAILSLLETEERQRLEQQIASGQITDAMKARADLERTLAARREVTQRNGESPLARRARELETTDIGDEVERYAVEELQHFQDGLRNAITKKLGIKDPFLASLLDLFIQQNIIKPLTQALAGANGGGGGDTGAAIVAGARAIFGFSGGGSGTIGGMGGTDTNTLSLNGQPFANVSRGETLSIGSKALNSRSSATIVQPIIQVDARGAVMNDQFATMILRQANQTAASMVQAGGRAINANIPNRIAQFQRDGT